MSLARRNREPQAEYSVISAEWRRRLNCDYKNDLTGHPILDHCVPIDRAIEQLLENKSLQTRPGSSAQQQGERVEDYGIDMPTAESSGRMTEKRR